MEIGMSINESFWTNYQVNDKDLDSLYNHLLETQIPTTNSELAKILIRNIIQVQKENLQKERLGEGEVYLPKGKYSKGQVLVFPIRNWQKGIVVDKTGGKNPELPDLEVITVQFADDSKVQFAANILDHKLNNPLDYDDTEFLNYDFVVSKFHELISKKLDTILSKTEDLVCIAGSYFPRALLVDVNVGHLNLCEAVLEMNAGGPLSTPELINQIELPTDVNSNLTEIGRASCRERV